jgi:hypothetical protein
MKQLAINISEGVPNFVLGDITPYSIMETSGQPYTFVTDLRTYNPDEMLQKIKKGCTLNFMTQGNYFQLPISAGQAIEMDEGWIIRIVVTLAGSLENYL